jgi:hypothetical protein
VVIVFFLNGKECTSAVGCAREWAKRGSWDRGTAKPTN